MCPTTLNVLASTISHLDRGLQRFQAGLVKKWQLGVAAPIYEPRASLVLSTFLPAHLPRSPVGNVTPRKRAKLKWRGRKSAWQLTEWIIVFLG